MVFRIWVVLQLFGVVAVLYRMLDRGEGNIFYLVFNSYDSWRYQICLFAPYAVTKAIDRIVAAKMKK